jgi:hypothetical protein
MMTRFAGAISLTVVAGVVPPELDVGFPDPVELDPEGLGAGVEEDWVFEDVFAFVEGNGVNGLRGVPAW